MLKAFAKVYKTVNFRLLLVGNGENLEKINNFILKNKFQKKIKLILNKNNPYPFIKIADVVILSSIYEGLPNVLLEGICLNKLIISSDCPTGPKEILDNGKGGILFKTGDFKDLSKKIKIIKSKKSLKNKIQFSNKRFVRFDYNLNLNRYYKIIKDYLH